MHEALRESPYFPPSPSLSFPGGSSLAGPRTPTFSPLSLSPFPPYCYPFPLATMKRFFLREAVALFGLVSVAVQVQGAERGLAWATDDRWATVFANSAIR